MSAMQLDPPDDNPPLSPWAGRYPTHLASDERPVWFLSLDGKQHSGLAYEYPTKDPKLYSDETEPDLGDVPSNGNDLVRFFIGEQIQFQALQGVTTAQSTSLNRWAWHSPTVGLLSGGHVPEVPQNQESREEAQARAETTLRNIFSEESLIVNESNWFSFFQKTVVWATLRLSFELANRMLNALIDDEQDILQTILFGRIEYWKNLEDIGGPSPDEESLVLLSAAMEASIPDPTGSQQEPKVPDIGRRAAIESRLNYCARNLWWSFMGSRGLQVEPAAETVTNGRQTDRFTIINISPVQLLLNGDLTISERCHLHFFLAQTIVHELMHAIMFERMGNVDDKWNKLKASDRKRVDELIEPFVDFDHLSEIGMAFESRIFNGSTPANQTGLNCIPLAHSGERWPFPTITAGFVNENHPVYCGQGQLIIDRYAAIQTARLLSENFWTGATAPARKSDFNWHRITIFSASSTTSSDPRYGGWPAIWEPVTIDKTNADLWLPGDAESVEAWDKRLKYLEICRAGWYEREKAAWVRTPWAYPMRLFTQIDIFQKASQTKNEAAGALACEQLSSILPWDDEKGFRDGLPTQTNLRNHDWIFFALSMLMYATMPVRTKAIITGADDEFAMCRTFLKPRSGTASGGPKEFKRSVEDFNAPPDTREANTFHDPFDQGKSKRPVTHEHYLNLVDQLLDTIKRNESLVSGPWYAEVQRVCGELRAERKRLQDEQSSNHQTRWSVRWTFVVPGYDPSNLGWMQWSNASNDWTQLTDLPPGTLLA
ncbi:hypothetical protein F5Y16DRAFT_416371 [Xylariaceae sp. FL0255]|nr:hypothetical protein F5Y16DRAFT_416371 [Xylariaceae sp. FL0255]